MAMAGSDSRPVEASHQLQVLVCFGTATCNFPFLAQCSKEQSQKQPSEGAVFFLALATVLQNNNNKEIFIQHTVCLSP